jgi:hypothetical protein
MRRAHTLRRLLAALALACALLVAAPRPSMASPYAALAWTAQSTGGSFGGSAWGSGASSSSSSRSSSRSSSWDSSGSSWGSSSRDSGSIADRVVLFLQLAQLLVWAYSVNVYFGLSITGVLIWFAVWVFTRSPTK